MKPQSPDGGLTSGAKPSLLLLLRLLLWLLLLRLLLRLLLLRLRLLLLLLLLSRFSCVRLCATP